MAETTDKRVETVADRQKKEKTKETLKDIYDVFDKAISESENLADLIGKVVSSSIVRLVK